MAFRRYHMLHHSHLGVESVDMDLPTECEARLFNSVIGRFWWLFLQPLFYALRPVLLKPLPLTLWEISNVFAQLAFNALLISTFGLKSFSYLLLGTLLGTGIHPMSGHFLEHLETVDGQETYSYYGNWNWFAYNVGYHNEHHDFPKIPGSRLPELRRLAGPRVYDRLHSYTSWCGLLYSFVVKGKSNLFCRVKRVVT